MAKHVRDAMTANPRTLRREASVLDAAKAMEEEDVGSLPVVDADGILVGMLTDRDIVLRVVAGGKNPASTTVGDVASKDVIPTYPESSLDDALQQMARRQVRRLPVVEDDRVVGVLAQADVVHESKEKKAGQLVEEISRPSERGMQH